MSWRHSDISCCTKRAYVDIITMLVQGIVSALCCLIVVSQQQFTFPLDAFYYPVSVQVYGEGRVFAAAGRQLFSLNRDLVLQQNVSLPSDVPGLWRGEVDGVH